jgi:hypothetical protein
MKTVLAIVVSTIVSWLVLACFGLAPGGPRAW